MDIHYVHYPIEEMIQMYCKNCGEILSSDNYICSKCGTSNEPEKRCYIKSPLLSAILSFIVPGLGQIYNGDMRKGAFFIIITLIAIAEGYSLLNSILLDPEVMILILTLMVFYALFWIFNVKDAYDVTIKRNSNT